MQAINKVSWRVRGGIALVLCVFLVVGIGCGGEKTARTSQAVAPKASFNKPADVKFSTFDRIVLKSITLDPNHPGSAGNDQRAVIKIDEHLANCLGMIFNNLEIVSNNATIEPGNTLVIDPYIDRIKFVSGGARFWVGAMAGSSYVTLQMKFIDNNNGQIVADTLFSSDANAYGGAYSVGGADNAMLKNVADDACQYINYNR